MTQIGGFIEATRRPGVLGVHSLDHFSMTVPDLEKAKTFYEFSSGLDVRKEGRGIALYTHGHPHRWGLLSEGPRKKLHYLSFGAFEDDLPRFRDHLNAVNVERLPPPVGFESNGLWFRNHDGVPIEIRVAEKSSPNAKSVFTTTSVGPAMRGSLSRSAAPVTRGAASRTFCSTRSMSDARSSSTARCSACACRTRRKAMSPSCTACTAAIITCSRSDARADPDCITAAGMSARSRTSVLAPCRWRTKASSTVGAPAATCSVRTTSTTCAIRGAATPNIPPISISFRPMSTGPRPIIRARNSFYLWGPTPPPDFIRNYEAEA